MIKESHPSRGIIVIFASFAWFLPSVGTEGLHLQVSWGRVEAVTGSGH